MARESENPIPRGDPVLIKAAGLAIRIGLFTCYENQCSEGHPRAVYTEQLSVDQVPIDYVAIDPARCHDISAVLKGFQHLYGNVPLRERVFALIEEHLLTSVGRADEHEQTAAARLNPGLGHPGTHPWVVLVLALLKQGIQCYFDRLSRTGQQAH